MGDHVAAENADKSAVLQTDDEAKAFVREYTVFEAENQLVLTAFKESSKPKSGAGRGRPRKTAHKIPRRLMGTQQNGRRQAENECSWNKGEFQRSQCG